MYHTRVCTPIKASLSKRLTSKWHALAHRSPGNPRGRVVGTRVSTAKAKPAERRSARASGSPSGDSAKSWQVVDPAEDLLAEPTQFGGGHSQPAQFGETQSQPAQWGEPEPEIKRLGHKHRHGIEVPGDGGGGSEPSRRKRTRAKFKTGTKDGDGSGATRAARSATMNPKGQSHPARTRVQSLCAI